MSDSKNIVIVGGGFAGTTLARALERVARIELETDPALRRRLGHFIVIGGGFSGVEVAGELADFLASARRYYPRVQPGELKVTILQDADRPSS